MTFEQGVTRVTTTGTQIITVLAVLIVLNALLAVVLKWVSIDMPPNLRPLGPLDLLYLTGAFGIVRYVAR